MNQSGSSGKNGNNDQLAGLDPGERAFLAEMEELGKRSLPVIKGEFEEVISNSSNPDFGINLQGGHVVGLRLSRHMSFFRNKTLPATVGYLSWLKVLELESDELESLPPEIGRLSSLKILYLNWNKLESLPREIGELHSLVQLWLDNNQLSSLPDSIGNLTSLEQLSVGENKMFELPNTIGNLKSLTRLTASFNQLDSLPEAFRQLTALKILSLHANKLSNLPEWIGNLKELFKLSLSDNPLHLLPESLAQLGALKQFTYPAHVPLQLIPERVKEWMKTRHISPYPASWEWWRWENFDYYMKDVARYSPATVQLWKAGYCFMCGMKYTNSADLERHVKAEHLPADVCLKYREKFEDIEKRMKTQHNPTDSM